MEKRQRRRELEQLEREVDDLQRLSRNGSSPPELARIREQVSELRREFFTHISAWQRTQLAPQAVAVLARSSLRPLP